MTKHLTRKELADRLGITVRTAERMWVRGEGPPGIRVGLRRIAYPVAGIEKWEAERTHSSRAAELAKVAG